METATQKTFSPFWKSFVTWRAARRALLGAAILATLLAIFYAEENWRGKRAWEECKRELEAKGEVVDWSAFVPKPVPDDQNIYKAPRMAEWFVRDGGGDLTKRLSTGTLPAFVQNRRSNAVVELTVVPPGSRIQTNAADVLLRFEDAVWSLASPAEFAEPPPATIPLIVLDAIPLTTALQHLARQADINFLIDPRVASRWEGTSGAREPVVTIRWENLTAREAFLSLLDAHGLRLVGDPKTKIGRVVVRDTTQPPTVMTAEARSQLERLIREAAETPGSSNAAPVLSTVRRIRFVTGDPPSAKTVRALVLSQELPDAQVVQNSFPRELSRFRSGVTGWRVEASPTGGWRLFPMEEQVCSAQEYLAWSDQFAPEFEIIREALRRPQAQLAGDNQRPFSLPIPNFVCVRQVAQMLAERAQCHLLLGQAEQALKDLTLMHDLHRMLVGKPALLVATMIDVAIAGLYTEIVADGFRLRAWREPELAALQQQLAELNLLPAVADSLRTERAAVCQTLLNVPASEVVELFQYQEKKPALWERVTHPAYLLMRVAPRGWVYQNLVTVARLEQPFAFGVFDPSTGIVRPGNLPREADWQKEQHNWNPFKVLARVAVPNFVRAFQTTARNQAKANQALVVCALERYRLVHGEYPESLAALAPGFVEKLPHDLIGGEPMKYRRTDDGKFLLYSVGWNQTDDGGKTTFRTDGSVEYDSPDWVWQLESR